MIRLEGSEATEALGFALASKLRTGDVIALSGNLGAGKTVFARGLLRGLGFSGDVVSPTFPIVQIYDAPGMRLPFWHVDLYRMESLAEIEQLGLDEARAEAVLAIEWPEHMGAALWDDALHLSLSVVGEDVHALTVKLPPAWEGRWLPL